MVVGFIAIMVGLHQAEALHRARLADAEAASAPSQLEMTTKEEDPVLARIASAPVRLSEVQRFARTQGRIGEDERLTAAAAFETDIVNRYVEQAMMARAASIDGLLEDDDVSAELEALRRAFADARARVLARAYLDRRTANATSNDAVTAFYHRARELADLGDEVRARYLFVRSKEEVDAIVAELAAGADFVDLVKTRSVDATARQEGDLGYFSRDQMAPALAEAAFATAVGQVSEPFRTGEGWSLVKVEDRRKRSLPSLSQLRAEIRDFLRKQALEEAIDELSERFYVEFYDPRANASQ